MKTTSRDAIYGVRLKRDQAFLKIFDFDVARALIKATRWTRRHLEMVRLTRRDATEARMVSAPVLDLVVSSVRASLLGHDVDTPGVHGERAA